jgi:hypothetical protein
MLYTTRINQLLVTTGDLLCTTDGVADNTIGQLWQALGYLVPGEVDHIIIYLGPDGRCVEAGGKGVILFDVPNETWNAVQMAETRWIMDTLVGVVRPLVGRGLAAEAEAHIRAGVARYCLAQVAAAKQYNLNFFDPTTDEAFYCSQLAYKAYLEYGIDLTYPATLIPELNALLPSIVFPQTLWENHPHERVPALLNPNEL